MWAPSLSAEERYFKKKEKYFEKLEKDIEKHEEFKDVKSEEDYKEFFQKIYDKKKPINAIEYKKFSYPTKGSGITFPFKEDKHGDGGGGKLAIYIDNVGKIFLNLDSLERVFTFKNIIFEDSVTITGGSSLLNLRFENCIFRDWLLCCERCEKLSSLPPLSLYTSLSFKDCVFHTTTELHLKFNGASPSLGGATNLAFENCAYLSQRSDTIRIDCREVKNAESALFKDCYFGKGMFAFDTNTFSKYLRFLHCTFDSFFNENALIKQVASDSNENAVTKQDASDLDENAVTEQTISDLTNAVMEKMTSDSNENALIKQVASDSNENVVTKQDASDLDENVVTKQDASDLDENVVTKQDASDLDENVVSEASCFVTTFSSRTKQGASDLDENAVTEQTISDLTNAVMEKMTSDSNENAVIKQDTSNFELVFRGCKFLEGALRTGVEFYHKMNSYFVGKGDYIQAYEFYVLEERCKNLEIKDKIKGNLWQRSKGWIKYIFSWRSWYSFFSVYGSSMLRPFVFFVFVSLLASLASFLLCCYGEIEVNSEECPSFHHYLIATFGRLTSTFGAFSEIQPIGIGSEAIVLIGNIFQSIFIILFFIALRRRFKVGY